jgi:hypothetical protein
VNQNWPHVLARRAAPGQPVVRYAGYSLKEPWGEPRVAPVHRGRGRQSPDQAPDLAGRTRVSFPAR